jgi:hypothetical protein
MFINEKISAPESFQLNDNFLRFLFLRPAMNLPLQSDLTGLPG